MTPATPAMKNISAGNRRLTAVLLVAGVALACSVMLDAHGVSGKDAVFLQGLQGRAIVPLMYLGAKHMVTGYDHLLFLVGVIFFLYRLEDVLVYVSLFAIGHSITLLAGVLGGIRANPYLIDAIIGFSVVYKAFENMDGFRRFFGFQPNTKAAVFVFGLFHGFGLATKLQDFSLARQGLVANIVSFNVGVEIGQVVALTAILIAFTLWRRRSGFARHALAFNGAVMSCGLLLIGYQMSGYFLASR
jgi:HupE/UreJ protein